MVPFVCAGPIRVYLLSFACRRSGQLRVSVSNGGQLLLVLLEMFGPSTIEMIFNFCSIDSTGLFSSPIDAPVDFGSVLSRERS